MIRKLVYGAAAAATIGGLFAGKEMFSYARTGVCSAREHLRKEVPVEFEIRRARHEVERLLPEVRKSLHLIAEEQVDVAQLQTSIANREKALKSQQEAILSLSSDLKNDDVRFVYAGHKYSRHEVEKDLAERFNRFKIAEDTVKREQQMLAAKEKALAANRETLEGMLSQKKNLEVELERLEARMRTIDARKQIHGLAVDDSQLTRVKTLISTIEKRLDVEDAVLASEGDLNGLIPVEQHQAEETGDITAKIDSYFSQQARDQVANADVE
ncbi:hypothetical protein SH661x_004584 [Planctomicrobium sp. SH661]|uniref:hypothetical protein n=1 Tax=Planctomicrobium sp. SH661 TaxID=3448124 RepID=UPI003F5C7794